DEWRCRGEDPEAFREGGLRLASSAQQHKAAAQVHLGISNHGTLGVILPPPIGHHLASQGDPWPPTTLIGPDPHPNAAESIGLQRVYPEPLYRSVRILLKKAIRLLKTSLHVEAARQVRGCRNVLRLRSSFASHSAHFSEEENCFRPLSQTHESETQV